MNTARKRPSSQGFDGWFVDGGKHNARIGREGRIILMQAIAELHHFIADLGFQSAEQGVGKGGDDDGQHYGNERRDERIGKRFHA